MDNPIYQIITFFSTIYVLISEDIRIFYESTVKYIYQNILFLIF